MSSYIGIAGHPGHDPNPFKHILENLRQHPDLGLLMGDAGHDATAVLVEEGHVVYAVEEERLNRLKHFMGLPELALTACEQRANGTVRRAYYFDPDLASLESRFAASRPHLDPSVQCEVEAEALTTCQAMGDHARRWPGLRFVDHHRAHAASAYYPSGFERALVVVMDGQGESASISVYLGDAQGLHLLKAYPITASLGILYASMTAHLGFQPIEDEYKVMGLAAYGTSDDYRAFFDRLIVPTEDGFEIPDLLLPAPIRSLRWSRTLGLPRSSDQPIEDHHIAMAFSLQSALERTVMGLLERHQRDTGARHLCLAGGVALNCSLNGVIDRSGLFTGIFVQPAAHDPGAALGAALEAYHSDHPEAPRQPLETLYLGPSYGHLEVETALQAFAGQVSWHRPDDLEGDVSTLLQAGKVIGWFQGRMEFGPRALGNRSILADARRADMKDRVNIAVKKREEFRPFAPSVTAEAAHDFFELGDLRQYEHMTTAVKARPERAAEIPAVVHVNGTSRVQVVRHETNPGYWALLDRFGKDTGVPMLLNTSFNVRGEPIVCSPEDALRCFLGTGIDHLALQGWLVSKR